MKSYYKYNPWQEKFDRVIANGKKINVEYLANKENKENKEKITKKEEKIH